MVCAVCVAFCDVITVQVVSVCWDVCYGADIELRI